MNPIEEYNITDTIKIGPNQPLVVLAGPCVLEEQSICDEIAGTMKEACDSLGISYVFKASFDKANRTSVDSFRGPGIDAGIEQFKLIKKNHGVPIVTDIHESWQPAKLAGVVDIMQIPAFLCRQTSLLIAAAETGAAINVKKGQFLAPGDMKSVLEKLRSTGNRKISLCERGTTFGYNNLVVDMRGIQIMRELGAPVIFDATHSVQIPGGQGNKSGGQPQFIAPLARAAASVGIDGLFLETHPEPCKALSDGANSLKLSDVKNVLEKVVAIRDIVNS